MPKKLWFSSILKRWQQQTLISGTLIYVLGGLLQNALAFLLIPVYTRYLTPEDFGISSVALAIGGVIGSLLGWGIFSSIERYYFEYKDSSERLKTYITSNFIFVMVSAGVITIYLNIWGERIWSYLTDGQVLFSPYIQLVLWESYGSVLFQFSITLFRTEQRATIFIFSVLARFILNLLIVVWLVAVWEWGVYGQLLGRLVSTGLITILTLIIVLRKWFTLRFQLEDVLISLRYSLPLLPHIILGWALNSFDRILLESRVSLAELGFYNLGYRMGMVMSVIVLGVNQAWMPYYMKLMKESENPNIRVKQMVELYTGIIGTVCLLGILFSNEILSVIATERYSGAVRFVPLILFAYWFNGYYFFLSAPLFFFRRTRQIPLMTAFSAAVNIVLNLWWIPIIGAMGSAWATFLAFFTITIIAYLLSHPLQPIIYPWPKLLICNALLFISVIWKTYSSFTNGYIFFAQFIVVTIYLLLAIVWFIYPNQHLWKRYAILT